MQPFRAPRKGKAQSSPTRQSPRRVQKQDQEQQHISDSEEDTASGLVYPPRVILETQYSDIEKLSIDGNPDNNDIGNLMLIEARATRSPAPNLKQPATSSTVPSPNLSEFEAFLDRASADSAVLKNKGILAAGTNKVKSKTKALQIENQRIASESFGDLVPVDFMLLDEHHNDNAVPIVSGHNNSLSLLVDVATQQVSSPQLRKKKAPKVPLRNYAYLST